MLYCKAFEFFFDEVGEGGGVRGFKIYLVHSYSDPSSRTEKNINSHNLNQDVYKYELT